MNLVDVAKADLAITLEDSQDGFGKPITFTDPAGNTGTVDGRFTEIGQRIDPETGLSVAGSFAHVSVVINSLANEGLGIPVNIPDEGKKPWVAKATDSTGTLRTYKVVTSAPDKELGVVTCYLQTYNE